MHLRIWVLAVAAVGVACGTLAVAALLAWPAVTLQPADAALARLSLPGYAGAVTGIAVRTASGARIPVTVRDGRIWPQRTIASGERLSVSVTVTRPSWAAWLVGRRSVRQLYVTTPLAHLETTWLQPAPGGEVALRFAGTVSVISLAGSPAKDLAKPSRDVPTGITARGVRDSGTIEVAAAPRLWEMLSPAVSVSWFVHRAGSGPQVLPSPAPSASLDPGETITLTFSETIASVLGSHLPAISPSQAGSWRVLGTHTLRLVLHEGVLGLGTQLTITLPRALALADARTAQRVRVLRWSIPLGSTLRLQQLLAGLGYLPLRWAPRNAAVANDESAQLAAALNVPSGNFSWRYPDTPASLKALWAPGKITTMTSGAVMMFEQRNGLAVDGIAGPEVWRALIADTLANSHRVSRYDYIYVHRAVPEALHLWVDGKTIFSSPANTGIAADPTSLGSYAVFEHIPEGTMRGENPNGTRYDDPGIRWISYFDHGEAIHNFVRASYGTPQSLGCVELPLAAAAHVWPYTPIGTLVTIEP